MIRKPTVLVLGAGASKEFGYPAGPRFKRDVLLATRNLASLISDVSEKPSAAVEKFGERFQASGCSSIDEFLHSNPTLNAIGKAAIAAALLPYEETHIEKLNQIEQPQTLYSYLWSNLRAGPRPENFRGSYLTVVTFNYDRSLEHCLHTWALNSFEDLDCDGAAKLVETIRIIHVHGQLGHLQWQNRGRYRPYGSELDVDQLRIASEHIRIIHEEVADSPDLAEARRLLSEAERIVFLGFGYHQLNMERLGVERFPDDFIYGTTLGLTGAERSRVKARWRALAVE